MNSIVWRGTQAHCLGLILGVIAVGTDAVTTHATAHQVENKPVWCAGDDGSRNNEAQPGDPLPGPENNRNMTNVELGAFSLEQEFSFLPGREIRVRFWHMGPGGIIRDHCHEDRPAYVYLLHGKVKETKEGVPGFREITAGEAALEGNGTRHWWINDAKPAEDVLMVAVDIPNLGNSVPEPSPDVSLYNDVSADVAYVDVGVTRAPLGTMRLRDEYPHIFQASSLAIGATVVTVEPGGAIGLKSHEKHPGIAYVISGYLLEHRTDERDARLRRAGEVSLANNGIWNWWKNPSAKPAKLFLWGISDCGECASN